MAGLAPVAAAQYQSAGVTLCLSGARTGKGLTMPSFCTKCGASIPEGNQFCLVGS